MRLSYFFFNDTSTTEIYTRSLHDALPIYNHKEPVTVGSEVGNALKTTVSALLLTNKEPDRKSTRLNSSHGYISYAVFYLKKQKYM